MCEPAERHRGASPPLMLPNPYVTGQSSRGSRSGLSLKRSQSNVNGAAAGKGGDMQRSQSYRSSQHARENSDHFLERERPVQDPHTKTSKNNDSHAQGRIMGKNSAEAQKRGFRSTRSAPNSAGRIKPAQADLVPFEVTMADFPELAGIPLGRAAAVQKECWGLKPISVPPKTQTVASPWKTGDKRSTTVSDPQQKALDATPDSAAISPGQLEVTSWANVASQPPKKPDPKEQAVSNNMQMEEVTQHDEGAQGKKKRKKKKKKTKGADDADADSEGMPSVYQEPPRFEDEEEFPGLTPASTGTSRLITSTNTARLCNEENQRDGSHQVGEQNKEKPAAKTPAAEKAKKGQKAEKESGKKSKVPVQLDIGNMLAALEKKQQSQKSKQDTNLVISVGGGLPVVHKQAAGQKKKLWQQDKIAHNPLDSTSPLVKKGKQREVPKAKKPTPLKKVILKEREERKQRRLLEERGLLPENEAAPDAETTEAPADEEIGQDTAGEENDDDDQQALDGTEEMVREADGESDKEETAEQHTTSTVQDPVSRPKIHSRKFRDYCSQMLSRDVDECVTALLKELVRFQDRLYQKDPMKARMKRRIVMGLREVLKHLKLRKVKCVIISPNCERIQSKGGLDEALHTIIDTCREQGVPFVFALSRKALGRCVNKVVPVSLVGIFNYDGAQDFYHKMIELSSEARRAYEVMVSSLEQTGQEEPKENPEESEPVHDSTEPEEEPDYMKIWKKMLENECSHKFLNIEEQLSSMHLDSECYENTEEEKS